jgi:hypothetical protein
MEKSELIQTVDKRYDTLGPALMAFAEAANDAETVRKLLTAAETRLAMALAVVEGN